MDRLELAKEIGIPITVSHYPPGTSKWNRIEHCVFSFISLSWKGQPLWNLETVIHLIGATRTRSGLRVKAVLDTARYETGVKISDALIDTQRIRRAEFHPEWNYTIFAQNCVIRIVHVIIPCRLKQELLPSHPPLGRWPNEDSLFSHMHGFFEF